MIEASLMRSTHKAPCPPHLEKTAAASLRAANDRASLPTRTWGNTECAV